jgi:hypothetical protein
MARARCASILPGTLTALWLVGCSPGAGAPDCAVPGVADEACFHHTVYSHAFEQTLEDTATGDFALPAHEFPPIPVDPKYTRMLNFRLDPMLPPWSEPLATNGPLILYSDDLDVLVFSPMDHFFTAWIELRAGAIHYGVEGDVERIPAGFAPRFLLVEGHGMVNTLERWGDLLLADRSRQRVDRYADTGLSTLGYWTDNGAYYYYQTEPGQNYEDTLLAVKADLDERGFPVGYFQLDSWWYFKAEGHPLIGASGLLRWEPMPEHFPDGLIAFQQRLGLPLVAHNRWFALDNDYRDEFEFVDGDGMSLPTGREVYDRFMRDAVSWGVITYEQDWLVNQYLGLPFLRSSVGAADRWFSGMAQSADEHGLTMQICMPAAANLMAALDHPNITTVRTSVDYQPSVSKETYWPQFHIVNLLAWALGVWPFKDNFHSSEDHGEAEALISALSGAMVGLGDRLGLAVREIAMRTCRSDGLLLKPDRPALPIDAMFLEHRRPFTTYTYSRRAGLGQWTYLAAYHLASEHPQRTDEDRVHALLFYMGMDVGKMFHFPARVTDWRVDLRRDLGVTGRVVAYDWRTGQAGLVETSLALTPAVDLYDWAYVVLAPVFSNGLALIGEPGKYVTLADRRFVDVRPVGQAIEVVLAGTPGEQVELLVYDSRKARLLEPFQATIGADGRAEAVLR